MKQKPTTKIFFVGLKKIGVSNVIKANQKDDHYNFDNFCEQVYFGIKSYRNC